MLKKKDIAACQRYRGYADMDAVEYKYPIKKAQKNVLRIIRKPPTPF